MAAKSDNNVIGINDDIPWHLPGDYEFLLETIKDSYLLTGRKTYESKQGQEIYNGRNDVIVLTRNTNFKVAHGKVVHSLSEAFQYLNSLEVKQVFILGGEEIYRESMVLADELIITEVHTSCPGQAFFPVIEPEIWEETFRKAFHKDENNQFHYSFVWYRRK